MMKLPLLLLFICSSTLACPIWQADMSQQKEHSWDYLLNPQDIKIASNPLFAKESVLKLTITPDSSWPNGQTRVEVKHNGCQTKEEQHTYISWEFYVQSTLNTKNSIAYWESDKSYQQSMGLFISPVADQDKTVNQLNFFTSLPKRAVHWQQILAPGKWHKLSLAIHWSESAKKGQVSVWHNNQLVVKEHAVQTKPDNNALFIQLGLHRNQSEKVKDSIYLRNVREVTSLQQLLE